MIALDNVALSALLVPGVSIRRRGTTSPIKYAKERLDVLVQRVIRDRTQILIPTPALSEMLVKIAPDRIAPLLDELHGSKWFRIEAFDEAAAIELADRTARAIAAGDKREGLDPNAPWQKVKVDRQIVSIAIVNGASEIVSDDPDVIEIGKRWSIKVTSVEDLELPPELIPPPLLAPLAEDQDDDATLEEPTVVREGASNNTSASMPEKQSRSEPDSSESGQTGNGTE